MKMKRKTIALLLALMMCLLLLSACGANNTPDAEEPPAPVNTPAEQQPEQEEPKQEEPEKAEEPTQEEPKEVNNAGTEFLALLQEEYENGFFEGEGPRHTYYCYNLRDGRAAGIYNGVVYIEMNYDKYGVYDIASKEIIEINLDADLDAIYGGDGIFIDGNFYYGTGGYVFMYDCNGTRQKWIDLEQYNFDAFDKGFFFYFYNGDTPMVLSYNLEEIAEIPVPQREIEHGLKEDMKLKGWFAVDGTVYAEFNGEDSLYRLNTDTYEWEDTGDAPASINGHSFLGKYISCNDGIYDRVSGERVFEYGELYHAACDSDDNLCYFGGDKYLGKNGSEYRWVNLTDLSMSEPLPFPEGKDVTILNDTYCVYKDKYGWFLRNYNDGTEETIMMFDN